MLGGLLMTDSVMVEAEGLVNGERAAAYGHPKENFERICLLWNAYLQGCDDRYGDAITEKDHAIMMILVKIARLQETPDHRDSLVDICGYAGTYEKLLQREAEELAAKDAAYEQYAVGEDLWEAEEGKALKGLELFDQPVAGEIWRVTEKSLVDSEKSGEYLWRASIRLTFFDKDGQLWYRRSGQNVNDHLEAPWERVQNKGDWEFHANSA